MRKGLFSFLLFVVAGLSAVHAYDFSATSPSGHTLYYEIISGTTNVGVVRPGTGSTYDNYVTGNVVIPATVTYGSTTYNVTGLRSIYDFSYGYDYGSFDCCSGLTSVTIPNSVTSIGNYAFYYCSGLTSVTIPNSVTTIGERAFSGCSGLTSVTIPNSVTSIGEGAFKYCSGLTSVTIPNSVTSIGSSAFQYCSGLTSVTIPNSVTSIGSYAFCECSGLTTLNFNAINCGDFSSSYHPFYNCTIATINIGDSVQRIPAYFAYSKSFLASVTIPNSVTSIGSYAFYNCSGLTSVTIPNSVTSIGSYAFSCCSGLTSVTIPNSVTTIGEAAFSSCGGLTSVVIPNSVTTIGSYAFSYCSGLTTLNFNAINCSDFTYSNYYYEYPPFYGCPISTITIGDSVQRIPAYFAYNLESLTSVTIPNSVTSIGKYAFYYCSGLASIIMGDSVDYIGEYVFDNTAYYINDTNWEDDLLYINDWLIAAKQSSPGEYVIKDNTRGIASGTFSSCSTIRSIKSKSEVPPMGSTWGIPTTTTINVPCQALSAYLAHSDWSAFTNIQAVPYDVELLVNNPTMGSVGFISNTCSSTMFQAFPNSGYIFQSWSDGNTQNPRILINLANDTTITANFVAEGTTTPDSDTIVIHDTIVVHDTIGLTIHDTLYLPIYDTVYITDTTRLHDTIYLPQYIHDTTYIVDTLLLTDTIYLPQYIHDTVYIHDTIYITGIENVATINAKIYSGHSRIVVEGANGNNVMLFDMSGRLLATKQDEYSVLEFDVPVSGAYFVKIGNYNAKKVVVIK